MPGKGRDPRRILSLDLSRRGWLPRIADDDTPDRAYS